MTQAKLRLPPELAALTRSQWEQLIREANLGDVDEMIATDYFIRHRCQIDIAIDLDTDRSTVSRRIKRAADRIKAII